VVCLIQRIVASLALTSAVGLGYALVASLVQQPRTNVIATVRSTESTAALDSLDVHESSNIVQVIVAFDSKTDATTLSAISSLPETYPWLIHIDTVIANASISTSPSRAIDTPASALRDHLAINAVAPAALFQATWPLLKLAPCPRFVVLSSMVGSIHDVPKTSAYASVAYGMSKAALNYWIRKIGAEHEDLAVMAIHPG